VGNYCAIAENGGRIDCPADSEENIQGKFYGDSAVVYFYSFYGDTGGVAIIKRSGASLLWQIITPPQGGNGCYAPIEAVLWSDANNAQAADTADDLPGDGALLIGKWVADDDTSRQCEFTDDGKYYEYTHNSLDAHLSKCTYTLSHQSCEQHPGAENKQDEYLAINYTYNNTNACYSITNITEQLFVVMALSANGNIISYHRYYPRSSIVAQKCTLYFSSSESAITKGYLIKDDEVGIIQKDDDWVMIQYFSVKTKETIVRWVKAEDIYGPATMITTGDSITTTTAP
jgi:hypothetical protein